MKRLFIGLVMLLSWCSAEALLAEVSPDESEFFEKKIRPVLVEHCYECHASTADQLEAELRLDSRDGLLKGGNSGAAIALDKPGESLLLRAISYEDEDLEMPPEGKLPDALIADLVRWVAMGVPWPDEQVREVRPKDPRSLPGADHWAFKPRTRPLPPAVKNETWVQSPIDRFILARLERHGLALAARADRRTLIRRATFDLVGLPPTPKEVEAFLRDDSPRAFAKVIDRLLASRHYGERWGRHWLDVARYADTSGSGSDTPIPEVYLYRDYVIDAFNRDMPYDEFIVEQIAGDRLAFDNPSERFRERIIATGFVANSRRFAYDKYSEMHLVHENAIDTIGKAMLGMSLGCARCHDHKFDPISQQDFFGLYGYFASTRYAFPGASDDPVRTSFVPLVSDPELIRRYEAYEPERGKLAKQLRKLKDRLEATGTFDGSDEEREKLRAELREKIRTINETIRGMDTQFADLEIAYAVVDKRDNTGDAKMHIAGNPDRLGPPVPRGFLSIITTEKPKIAEGEGGRLKLARWIASPDNPLTARVMANRLWHHHFGTGIVPTPNMFGTQGQRPVYPALLDWLANELVEGGWTLKRMHRLIMLSATYQLASAPGKDPTADPPADPAADRTIWRYEPHRLEAEAIRDALLAVSGTLDRTPGGPHPFPPNKRYGKSRPFDEDYDHNRRSVYLMQRRLGKHPFLTLFDGPDNNMSTGKREVSTMALQALYMMNSPMVREKSEAFAERVMQAASDDAERVRLAYELAFARLASKAEVQQALEYIARHQKKSLELARGNYVRHRAWADFCHVLLSSNEFIYVD